MPELPEVETTRRGIQDHICGKSIQSVIVRQPRLRYEVPGHLAHTLEGARIKEVERRGKYLLLKATKERRVAGHLIIHLGMSGSLSIQTQKDAVKTHDHVDLVFNGKTILRYHDPRRFGLVLWTEDDPLQHDLLKKLGPEPLTGDFDGEWLFEKSRKRTVAVKNFIMNSHVVVGVGNIYANEALFMAGIKPTLAANKVSKARYMQLVEAIKTVLAQAIEQGGTTLKNFVGGDGKPGYFKQSLQVYGRGGLPCPRCGKLLKEIQIGQRATVYCGGCQK